MPPAHPRRSLALLFLAVSLRPEFPVSLGASFFSREPARTVPDTCAVSISPMGGFFLSFSSVDSYDPCVQRDHVFKVLRSNKQRTGAIHLFLSHSFSFSLSLFPRTLDFHRFFMISFSPFSVCQPPAHLFPACPCPFLFLPCLSPPPPRSLSLYSFCLRNSHDG